jgi:hypothetical protein
MFFMQSAGKCEKLWTLERRNEVERNTLQELSGENIAKSLLAHPAMTIVGLIASNIHRIALLTSHVTTTMFDNHSDRAATGEPRIESIT